MIQRTLRIAIVTMLAVAWAGFYPAQAAVCGPFFEGMGYARGDGLFAYASLLQEGGIDAALSGGNIDHVIIELRDSVDVKDLYSVDWEARFDLGCGTGDVDPAHTSWTAQLYYGMEGLFTFTPGLFDMVGGTTNPVDFTLSNDIVTRRGVTIRTEGLIGAEEYGPLFSRMKGSFIFHVWEIVDYEEMVIDFHRPSGSSHLRLTQSVYKKPTPGEWVPPNSRPFSGGGYSLGFNFLWPVTDKLTLNYTVDSVLGREWADGMIYKSTTINTDKQYVGIDGYLKELPLSTGTIRRHSFSQTFASIHRVDIDLDWTLPIRIGAAYDWADQAVKDVSVGTTFHMGRARIGLGFEAEDRSVTAGLVYPASLGRTDLLFHLNARADHLTLHSISAVGLSGGLALRF